MPHIGRTTATALALLALATGCGMGEPPVKANGTVKTYLSANNCAISYNSDRTPENLDCAYGVLPINEDENTTLDLVVNDKKVTWEVTDMKKDTSETGKTRYQVSYTFREPDEPLMNCTATAHPHNDLTATDCIAGRKGYDMVTSQDPATNLYPANIIVQQGPVAGLYSTNVR